MLKMESRWTFLLLMRRMKWNQMEYMVTTYLRSGAGKYALWIKKIKCFAITFNNALNLSNLSWFGLSEQLQSSTRVKRISNACTSTVCGVLVKSNWIVWPLCASIAEHKGKVYRILRQWFCEVQTNAPPHSSRRRRDRNENQNIWFDAKFNLSDEIIIWKRKILIREIFNIPDRMHLPFDGNRMNIVIIIRHSLVDPNQRNASIGKRFSMNVSL